MTLPHFSEIVPESWLAFELSILRRMKFSSVADPFAGEADLDVYLKRWGVRVASNDVRQWASVRAAARVENNAGRLSEGEVELVLEDAYVPRHRLHNASLRRWFNETDAWWFDNVRASAEKLDTPSRRALALDIGMMVGDYALSFGDDTRELRQPLSRVFRRLLDGASAPVNNGQNNTSSNTDPRDFINHELAAELLFLRLPRPSRRGPRDSDWAWREEWVRGGDEFWDEYEEAREGRLGTRAETRQQYLRHVEDLLDAASHIPAWAIAHVENGFVSTEELVEAVRRMRRVGTIYTKDFTELLGVRAAIITA
ncbi:MAG: hypothetical protein LC754_11505 [Acidobacteria bacterium]|nr:hypothetical protein [Acidobacteriota bacterium]